MIQYNIYIVIIIIVIIIIVIMYYTHFRSRIIGCWLEGCQLQCRSGGWPSPVTGVPPHQVIHLLQTADFDIKKEERRNPPLPKERWIPLSDPGIDRDPPCFMNIWQIIWESFDVKQVIQDNDINIILNSCT